MQYIYATIIKSDFMVIKGHHMLHLKYMFQLITVSERQQTRLKQLDIILSTLTKTLKISMQ